MATTRRKRRQRRDRSEIEQEALERALENKSEANYPVIVAGFVAKGVPDAEIRPRENVFTYHAWHARGRQVRRGEHGVKVHTVLDVERRDPATGETTKVQKHRTATVFHVSQTDPIGTPRPAGTGAPPRPHNESPRPAGALPTSAPPPGLPERLRAAAEGLTERIRHLSRPLSQNYTAKRNAQYRSRLHDAANLRELQRALIVLAEAHERGTCPPELAHLRHKSEIAPLVTLRADHVPNGYHSYLVTKPGEYHDNSPAARILQAMLAGRPAGEGDEDDDERSYRVEIERLETELRGQDIPGFFPTPATIAEALVELADIRPGQEVLEPSAGIGSIAELIRDKHPDADLTCIELRPAMCEILRLKSFSVIEADFLKARGAVDRIVMNPPFEKGQDIDHVRHAYDLLKPGGRLVAIMSAGAFQRSGRKSREFTQWLVGLEGVERSLELDGLFNSSDAFRRTGVRIAVLVLTK